MKRFIVSILCVSVFFIGLGSLVDRVSATFKSDEKALTLIKQARIAIGGDANINNVRALTITGKATQTFTLDGAAKSEQGDLEINLQLPNLYSKMLKIGSAGEGGANVRKEVDVVVVRKEGDAPLLDKIEAGDGQRKVFVMKKGEGEPVIINSDGATADGKHKFIIKKDGANVEEFSTADGNKIIVNKERIHAAGSGARQNELFRTLFALLLSAPEGSDVSYTFAGEADVDGNSCNVVAAQTGGETFKLYLDKSTSLPRMMTFQAAKPFVIKLDKNDAAPSGEKRAVTFVRHAEAMEKAEFQLKFSDYRSVGGLQMPYKWTQTVGGQTDQIVDITNYEINPSGIAEKFQTRSPKVMIRTPKPQ